MARKFSHLLAVLFLSCFFSPSFAIVAPTPPPISGHNPEKPNSIIPADVLARVKLVGAEVNLIRQAMGKKKRTHTLFVVKNASPREAFSQAEILFQEANQLGDEVHGGKINKPEIDLTKINRLLPMHVWQMVNAALERVLVVKTVLKIDKKVKEKLQPQTTTPTNVFNAILKVNYQLSPLLSRPLISSDVFEQVTLAINVTEQLLKPFNVLTRIPKEPNYQPDKTNHDVYQQLVQCVQILQSIAKLSNVRMLEIIFKDYQADTVISPQNQYELAKIIVSEVKYFHSYLVKNPGAIESYYSGYKTPADVYQRTGLLLEQLKLLQAEVQQNPKWLSDKNKAGKVS